MSSVSPLPPGFTPPRYGAMNALWRSTLNAALAIAEDDFQVVLGAAGDIRTDGPLLSRLCDATPDEHPAVHCRHLGARRRSTGYRRLIGALQSDTELHLQSRLGPHYGDWVQFRTSTGPARRQSALFRDWCRASFPRRRAQQLSATFDALARTDAVLAARDRIAAEIGESITRGSGMARAWLPGYTASPCASHPTFFTPPERKIAFDSDHLPSAPPDAAAPHAGYCLLPGARAGIFDPLERKLLGSRITVTGQIGERAVVPVDPCAWYDPQLVDGVEFRPNDAQAWEGVSIMGGWASFFGPGRELRRCVTRLVFVRGFDLTVSFHGAFAPEDTAGIHGMAGQGVWPLLTDGAAAAPEIEFLPHDPRRLSVRLRQRPGQIACLGRVALQD